jgi:hypothetical protein
MQWRETRQGAGALSRAAWATQTGASIAGPSLFDGPPAFGAKLPRRALRCLRDTGCQQGFWRHPVPICRSKPDTSQAIAIVAAGRLWVNHHKANGCRWMRDTGFIRRIRGRYVAGILLRRMSGVTVLCDESCDFGGRRVVVFPLREFALPPTLTLPNKGGGN